MKVNIKSKSGIEDYRDIPSLIIDIPETIHLTEQKKYIYFTEYKGDIVKR